MACGIEEIRAMDIAWLHIQSDMCTADTTEPSHKGACMEICIQLIEEPLYAYSRMEIKVSTIPGNLMGLDVLSYEAY